MAKQAKRKPKPKASPPAKQQDATPADKGKAASKRKAKKDHVQSPHWQDELAAELAGHGLRVKPVAADGNCFFRAVVDQTEGPDGDHMELRLRVVHHMRMHPDDYAPYMEDDEDFAHYCKRMAQEGTWAGQQEQVAVARLLGCQLRIYQAGQPAWTLRPADADFPQDAPTLHLSYHEGAHYNSVRLADDFTRGPPEPIGLAPRAVQKPPGGASKAASWSPAAEVHVMQCTGCCDPGAVQQALKDSAGRAEQAIELLIERLALEADEPSANGHAEGQHPLVPNGVHAEANAAATENAAGHGEEAEVSILANGSADQLQKGQGASYGPAHETAGHSEGKASDDAAAETPSESCSDEAVVPSAANDCSAERPSGGTPGKRGRGKAKHRPVPEQQPDAEPARNKACPCGSHKKYKSCCGAAKAAAKRRGEAAAEPGQGMVQLATLYI